MTDPTIEIHEIPSSRTFVAHEHHDGYGTRTFQVTAFHTGGALCTCPAPGECEHVIRTLAMIEAERAALNAHPVTA